MVFLVQHKIFLVVYKPIYPFYQVVVFGTQQGGPLPVINRAITPINGLINKWVSLGLFHPELSGVITTLLITCI